MSEKNSSMPEIIIQAVVSLDGRIAFKDNSYIFCNDSGFDKFLQEKETEKHIFVIGVGNIIYNERVKNKRYLSEIKAKKHFAILDSSLRIHLDFEILKNAEVDEIIIYHHSRNFKKISALKKLGAKVIKIDKVSSGLKIRDIIAEISSRDIKAIIVNSSTKLNSFFIKEKLVDKLHLCYKNILIGGDNLLFSDLGIIKQNDEINLKIEKVEVVKNGYYLEATVNYQR
ncbi:MAG: dihydrofolate reductase family protein [Candidatus Cloacimonadota bacterium]|nr:dihydrofolate reductase family protein [Candidatus Cloacimonadota bacterium]